MENVVKGSQVMGPQYGIIEKFEGKQYMFWKFKIEILLKTRELWGFIDGMKVKPKGNVVTLLAYMKMENKALKLLVQSLFEANYWSQGKKITKRIWETFAKCYVDKGLANKIFLTYNFSCPKWSPLTQWKFISTS